MLNTKMYHIFNISERFYPCILLIRMYYIICIVLCVCVVRKGTAHMLHRTEQTGRTTKHKAAVHISAN